VEIQWEAPPEAALARGNANRGGPYLEFAMALRENPEKWARVPRTYGSVASANAAAQNMRAGKVKGFAKGQYEVVRDEAVLWARYIGDESTEQPQEPAEKSQAPKASPKPTPTAKDAEDGQDDEDDEPIEPRSSTQYTRRVRTWARENGHDVGLKGRLPRDIFEAYHRETSEPWPQAPLRSVR
jgi:hypothetical protein